MAFPPFSFKFPSSSTSLSSDGKPANVSNTSIPSSTSTTPTVSQFMPPGVKLAPISPVPKVSSPTIELDTTSSLNVAAAVQQAMSNSIYCNRRRDAVFELNCTNLQLNLIDSSSCNSSSSEDKVAHFTPSKFLYALKNWPENSKPKQLLCNALGNLLLIQGAKGNLTVLRLKGNAVSEEIEIDAINGLDIAGVAWHPASPADHHLVVLSKNGRILLFDLLQAKSDYSEFDDQLVLLRLTEIEQEIKLPVGRSDSFAGISFCAESDAAMSTADSWLRFTALLVKESGDIFALCPLLPLQFRAQRKSHLLKLKSAEDLEGTTRKWLDEVLLSSEFVASATGDVDWVLCKAPASFADLQPRLQGPFLVQPEPVEIHHLASYDRVVDFSAWMRSDLKMAMAAVAFGSGKVDVLAFASEIFPKFQLKGSLLKQPLNDLPVMALIESVDLKGSLDKTQRRSVDNKVKILGVGKDLLVSTDNSVIRIALKISYDADIHVDNASDNSDDWTIECDATVLVEKLKNHVLCISNSKIYPGAIKLDESASENEGGDFTVATSGLLDVITKYAFPLGKMEIEGGALQLDSLIDNLTATMKRLKSHVKPVSSKSLLEIDETVATQFNDHVSEWQESLVSPAIRVGHEITLRANELVQILRRQRDILVRARTLLTAKPERIELLLKEVKAAKEKNLLLMERVKTVARELAKHSVYDQLLASKLSEISAQLSRKDAANGFEIVANEEQLVESQLLIQSEKLMKIKSQLGKI